MILTSKQMTREDAIVVLMKMFGSDREPARALLRLAEQQPGQWTNTPVVQAMKVPRAALYNIRYNKPSKG